MHFEITHIQGGMREFERTGIYPEYLLFNLPGTSQSWRVKIKKNPQEEYSKVKERSFTNISLMATFVFLEKLIKMEVFQNGWNLKL